ncbi:hypothetical protein Tco_1323203 [Tanacetum coccineum]
MFQYLGFRVRSQPDPETPIPTAAEIDIYSLDEATPLSIAIARSLEDLEAQHNIKKLQEHLVDEEIKKIMEGGDNGDGDEFMDEIFNRPEDPDKGVIRKDQRKKRKGIVKIKDTPHPHLLDPLGIILLLYLRIMEKLWELTASDPTPSSSKPRTSSLKSKPYRVK